MGIFDMTGLSQPSTGMLGNPLAGQGLLTGGSNPWLALIGRALQGGLAGAAAARGTGARTFGAGLGVGGVAGLQGSYEAAQNKRRNMLADQQIQSSQIQSAATLDQLNRRRAFLGQPALSQQDFTSGNWGGIPGQTPGPGGGSPMPALSGPAGGGAPSPTASVGPAASTGPAWKAYLDMSNRALQYGLTDEANAYRAAAEADPEYQTAKAMGLIPVDVAKQKALLPGEVAKEDALIPGKLRVANAGRNLINIAMPPGETMFQKTLGEEQGKQAAQFVAGQDLALKTIDQVQTYRGLLAQYKAAGGQPGKLAPLKNDVSALVQSVGLNPSSFGLETDAGIGQALQASSNALMMGKLGPGGFPSQNFSDTDRAFLEKTVPRLNQTERGQLMIADIAERTAKRQLEAAQAFSSYPQTEAGFQQFKRDWAKRVAATPLFSQTEIAAAQAEAKAAGAGGATTPAAPGAGGAYDYDPATGVFKPR